MDLADRDIFRRIVRKQGWDWQAKAFTCRNQFVSMLFLPTRQGPVAAGDFRRRGQLYGKIEPSGAGGRLQAHRPRLGQRASILEDR